MAKVNDGAAYPVTAPVIADRFNFIKAGPPESYRIGTFVALKSLLGQGAFDTRILLAAATIVADVDIVRTGGYATAGDGGGATYKRVGSEPSHDFKVTSGDGVFWEGVVENGQINPRAIGGTSDQVSAEKAFDYAISEGPNNFVIVFSGLWTIASTVTISDPQDVQVDARGAEFTTPNDILMFDLNGRADPTYADNESRQNFHWLGGRFTCTFSTPTKATAFRMMGFRHASLRPEHFKDWYRDIILGDKDTYYIGGYKSQNAQNTSIEIPPWSRVGGPLGFIIEKIHVSPGSGGGKFINSYGAMTDCVLRDFSCNLGTNADVAGAVDIHSDVTLGLSAQSGTFADGELVTGASGATCVFRELYTHDFAFDIAQNLVWLVGEDRSTTVFVTGDTLTAPSGATGTIGADAAYINQDSGWDNFKIEGDVHFEAGSGANGAIGIRLRDRINRGLGDTVFSIDAGKCGLNGAGAIGVELQNLGQVTIKGRFSQGSASSSIPIKLNSGCNSIKILKPSFFATGAIDLNGMDRDELDLSDFNKTFTQAATVTGWTPKALATTADTILDMSADFGNFALVGGLAPVAYEVSLWAIDAASAANSVRFRMHHPDDTTSNLFYLLDLNGVTNATARGAQFTVGADSNGDIEYNATASAGTDLDVTLNIRRMLY